MTEYIIAHCVDSVSGVRYDERREEIVRCRDCVFFAADVSTVDENGEQIATGNLCEWTELWVEPCGFCSWAERRDE